MSSPDNSINPNPPEVVVLSATILPASPEQEQLQPQEWNGRAIQAITKTLNDEYLRVTSLKDGKEQAWKATFSKAYYAGKVFFISAIICTIATVIFVFTLPASFAIGCAIFTGVLLLSGGISRCVAKWYRNAEYRYTDGEEKILACWRKCSPKSDERSYIDPDFVSFVSEQAKTLQNADEIPLKTILKWQDEYENGQIDTTNRERDELFDSIARIVPRQSS